MVNRKRLCLEQKQGFDLSVMVKFKAAMDRIEQEKTNKSEVIGITVHQIMAMALVSSEHQFVSRLTAVTPFVSALTAALKHPPQTCASGSH